MTDEKNDPTATGATPPGASPAGTASAETPIQRALRLKKATLSGRGGPPNRQRGDGEREAAARSQSKSKPWMKK